MIGTFDNYKDLHVYFWEIITYFVTNIFISFILRKLRIICQMDEKKNMFIHRKLTSDKYKR